MKLVRERRTMMFCKEGFEIMYRYYLCEESGEGFEGEGCLRGNLERIHDLNLVLKKILFTDYFKIELALFWAHLPSFIKMR